MFVLSMNRIILRLLLHFEVKSAVFMSETWKHVPKTFDVFDVQPGLVILYLIWVCVRSCKKKKWMAVYFFFRLVFRLVCMKISDERQFLYFRRYFQSSMVLTLTKHCKSLLDFFSPDWSNFCLYQTSNRSNDTCLSNTFTISEWFKPAASY